MGMIRHKEKGKKPRARIKNDALISHDPRDVYSWLVDVLNEWSIAGSHDKENNSFKLSIGGKKVAVQVKEGKKAENHQAIPTMYFITDSRGEISSKIGNTAVTNCHVVNNSLAVSYNLIAFDSTERVSRIYNKKDFMGWFKIYSRRLTVKKKGPDPDEDIYCWIKESMGDMVILSSINRRLKTFNVTLTGKDYLVTVNPFTVDQDLIHHAVVEFHTTIITKKYSLVERKLRHFKCRLEEGKFSYSVQPFGSTRVYEEILDKKSFRDWLIEQLVEYDKLFTRQALKKEREELRRKMREEEKRSELARKKALEIEKRLIEERKRKEKEVLEKKEHKRRLLEEQEKKLSERKKKAWDDVQERFILKRTVQPEKELLREALFADSSSNHINEKLVCRNCGNVFPKVDVIDRIRENIRSREENLINGVYAVKVSGYHLAIEDKKYHGGFHYGDDFDLLHCKEC